jgi:hypothetical protein
LRYRENISVVKDEEEERVRESRKRKKDKEFPVQAWTGPDGSRRLRLPDIKKFGT